MVDMIIRPSIFPALVFITGLCEEGEIARRAGKSVCTFLVTGIHDELVNGTLKKNKVQPKYIITIVVVVVVVVRIMNL